MATYRVKRNIPVFTIIFILVVLAAAAVLAPIKQKTITGMETYLDIEPETELIPYNVTETITKNVTVKNTTKVMEDINYTLTKDDEVYKTSDEDGTYANQDYIFTAGEKITGCYYYDYEFFENSRVIEDGNGKFCITNSRYGYFKTKEEYERDIDDFSFKAKIRNPPQKEVEKTFDYVKEYTETINVTKYRNATYYKNSTKERPVNITKRTWLFG